MLDPEGASNLSSPEIKTDVGENLETNLRPELGVEIPTAGEEQESAKELPEEQLKNLGDRIDRLQETAAEDRGEFDKAREELGLPPSKEEKPAIEDELEKLRAEQEALEQRQEKERMIKQEKEKILQEKLGDLSKEFEALTVGDRKSILKSGKTKEGGPLLGELDPETAMSLAKAFEKGIKLLPKILEILPELMKEFDEELTKEATERVEKRLEEEKQKKEGEKEKPEGLKSEEKLGDSSEGGALSGGIKQKLNPIETGSAEAPKA